MTTRRFSPGGVTTLPNATHLTPFAGSSVGAVALRLACFLPAPLAAQDLRPLTAEAVLEMADRQFGMAQQAGGAAVVTVVKGAQVLFMKGYGLANPKAGIPVDPTTTLFRIGSTTKVFTAIAALQLIEQGVIDPDANVNTYLSRVGVRIDDRFTEPVTMRDLLALQAGRFDWTYSYYYPLHDDATARLPPDEISRRLWRTARPGDVPAYDNNGLGLVGFVAEAAAGQSYRDLVRTGVFEPSV